MTELNIFSFYSHLWLKIMCVYLSVWAIRQKGEIDYKLDRLQRAVRYSIVFFGFVLGYLAPNSYFRVAFGSLAILFLCWPNFAYHLVNLFRRDHGSGQNVTLT